MGDGCGVRKVEGERRGELRDELWWRREAEIVALAEMLARRREWKRVMASEDGGDGEGDAEDCGEGESDGGGEVEGDGEGEG